MADSDAIRSRRKRMHAQGDHSFCTSRCQARRPAPVLAAAPEIPAGDFDPAAEMRNLAVRLAAAYAADPGNAPLARELRTTLLAIDPLPEGPDEIDMLQRAEWASRRAARSDPEVRDLLAEFRESLPAFALAASI